MTDITIIGGGIAGLTAALTLLRKGCKVTLFEMAEKFEEVGAGITLSQPASRGLFSLGLQSRIEAIADIPARAGSADYASGQRIDGTDRVGDARERGDIPYFYQIHRADLHSILVDAVMEAGPGTIRLGHRLAGIEQDEQGVTAHFENGSSVRSGILLGADGINSRVRSALFGEENPCFTGQVAYRFLIPAGEVKDYIRLGPSVNYLGPGRQLLRYLIRKGTLVNGVAFVRTESWTGEGWSTPATREEMLAHFAGWNDDVIGLLSNAPLDGTRKWALFDRDPLPRWTVGRVTMMGDSAHPMLPFLGLGAAMGIEDAVVFGRAWEVSHDPLEAIAVYEETRRDRANHVLLASRRQGEIHQAENQAEARRNAPSQEFLMEYDPSTVELAAV